MLITPALSISFIKILLIYNTVVDAIMQGVPPCRLAVLVGLYSTKKFCEMEPNFMSGDGQSYVHAGRRISKSVSQTMLKARPARPEAPMAPEAVLGGGSGRGSPPPGRGFRGYHPRENFRNLTTLMCILETENFTFVLHVHS
jgi:hypothetical protein